MKATIKLDERGHEIRQTEARLSADGTKLIGYAAVFNQLSEDMGNWRERLAPGAFKNVNDGADVRALWQHDSAFVLGRTKAETLAVTQDEVGLRVVIQPPDAQWAKDAVESIRRGDVDQMSFAFTVPQGGDRWDKQDGLWIRTVLEAQLFEVSPVTFPAYPQTSIGAREMSVDIPDSAPEDLRVNSRARLAIMRLRLNLDEKI
jgi:uncharacterized protein